jgi:RNA polymerase sigma factor (sigma-70 family)
MNKTTRKTFEVVYKALALPMTKFVVKRVGGDKNAVDEILSRTMIAAWKSWNSFENKSSYFTWVCRIALNKASDYYREEVNRNSKFISPLLTDLANYDSRELTPEEWYELNELCNSVKSCIKVLPKDKQEIIYLRFWKGWAIKKIAKEFGVSERTIEGQIYRTKQKLKTILSDTHPEIAREYSKRLH